MTTTPIRTLMQMHETCSARQSAVDRASNSDTEGTDRWAAASRVWSRQHDGLTSTILAEPPQNFDDVLAVLLHLVGRRDMILGDEGATKSELRDLQETTDVALKNCVVALAAMVRPDGEPTEFVHDSLHWISGHIGQWLPPATAADAGEGER
jgi:hypothetical protein